MVALYSLHLAFRIAFAAILSCTVTSSFCYIRIYYKLRISQAQVQDQGHQGQPSQVGIQVNRVRYKKTVSTASLMFIYATLNPLLYCWRIRELRQAVKDMIKDFCCLSQHEAT